VEGAKTQVNRSVVYFSQLEQVIDIQKHLYFWCITDVKEFPFASNQNDKEVEVTLSVYVRFPLCYEWPLVRTKLETDHRREYQWIEGLASPITLPPHLHRESHFWSEQIVSAR
jgi:hypothetical protein